MDLGWIYRGFFIRDVLGYVLPGSIALFALVMRLDPEVVGDTFWDPQWWMVVGLWVPLAYVAGVVVQNFGVLTHFLVTDLNWGWAGNPAFGKTAEDVHAFRWLRRSKRSRKYRDQLVQKYTLIGTACGPSTLDNLADRQIAFMHISGNTSIALVMLQLSGFVEGGTGADTAAWRRLLSGLVMDKTVWGPLLASAIILWLAHHRYCRNLQLMWIVHRDLLKARDANAKPE